MFFAIALLLVQPQIAPYVSSLRGDKIELIQEATAPTSTETPVSEGSLPPSPMAADAVADATAQPIAESSRAELPDAPIPATAVDAPMAPILANPVKPMTVSVDELRAENRRKLLLWKGLSIASSGAATFDAWSTRHVLTTVPGSQELDPLLKPFAGNDSIYAAIQVAPLLLDYAGKKMMYSSHSWMRRFWWAPQTASFVTSMFCGAHNLAVN